MLDPECPRPEADRSSTGLVKESEFLIEKAAFGTDEEHCRTIDAQRARFGAGGIGDQHLLVIPNQAR